MIVTSHKHPHNNGQRRATIGIFIILCYIALVLTLAFLAELLHAGGAF
jgi:hypothetical protein